jgi:hypothetical protein
MEGFYNGGQVPAHGNEIKYKTYTFYESEMVEIGFVLEHVFYKKPINTKDMQKAFDIFFERMKDGGIPLSVLVEEKVKELIGELKEGEHLDEINPRSGTWLDERRSWQAEVKQLQDHIKKLEHG